MSRGQALHLLSRTVRNSKGCMEYTGCVQANGYARATVSRKADYAHRHIYRMLVGEIPEGMDVCHACDNRRCINPAHLFTGSRLENMQVAVRKGRQAKGERLSILRQGERSSSAKLSAEQVKAIRQLRGMGLSTKDLATLFKCSPDNIRQIVRRNTWRHVA